MSRLTPHAPTVLKIASICGWKCDLCTNYSGFSTDQTLARHYRNVHKMEHEFKHTKALNSLKTFKCPDCNVWFVALTEHRSSGAYKMIKKVKMNNCSERFGVPCDDEWFELYFSISPYNNIFAKMFGLNSC